MSSYVQIRYGSNQTLICNTDCICINLLQYIRENCTSLSVEVELDLVDSFGSTKNLRKLDLHVVFVVPRTTTLADFGTF